MNDPFYRDSSLGNITAEQYGGYYDSSRGKNLSYSRIFASWGKSGNARGLWLPVWGSVDAEDNTGGFLVIKPATITAVSANRDKDWSGNNWWGVTIYNEWTDVYEMVIDTQYSKYYVDDLNIDIGAGDNLQVYLWSDKNSKNVLVNVELVWRVS